MKSARGTEAASLQLERTGPAGDRRWMMVDPRDRKLTMREEPRLVLLEARRAEDGGLVLGWRSDGGRPEHDTATVEVPAPDAPRIAVDIWGTHVEVALSGGAADAWVSQRLGRSIRLAWLPDDVERPVNPRYASPRHRTTLTDGYPLHVIGTGSIEDLSERIGRRVEVERFRPNVLVQGTRPYEEDEWSEIRIGECRLRIVKACPRCAVTTVDPATAEKGEEPLRTLAGYRRRPGGVMFGQNAVHEPGHTLVVGQPVTVLRRRDAPGE